MADVDQEEIVRVWKKWKTNNQGLTRWFSKVSWGIWFFSIYYINPSFLSSLFFGLGNQAVSIFNFNIGIQFYIVLQHWTNLSVRFSTLL